MSKTIYITEEVANSITSYLKPISDLPQDIKNVLKNHKTSLGVHPAFPPEEEMSFDYILTKTRFDEVCSNISKLNLEDYSLETLNKTIQNLMNKCKEIEKSFKEKLENICFNYVVDLFQVPEGLVEFSCNLVETVDSNKAQVDNNFEFQNIKHRSRLQDAVYKRRIINTIITGGAIRLSYISKNLIGELYEISPELPTLYRNIITINEYLLFTKNNMGISEKNKKQSGISFLTIGDENTKNKIVAQGEIFPILLHESIKAFLEMFAAYGLPSSKNEVKYVLSKADFINAEPWDMRMGPILWDILIKAFNEPENEKLPLILTTLFSQTTFKFNEFLQEILGETKRSEKIIEKIMEKVEEDLNADNFDELMAKKQTETSLIQDQYFLPEEL